MADKTKSNEAAKARNKAYRARKRGDVDAPAIVVRVKLTEEEKYQRSLESQRRYNAKVTPEAKALYYAQNKLAIRAALRLKKFGLTQEQYDQMLIAQDGCCAICRSDKPSGRGYWHTDHDHVTGKVRGLLCHHCNLMLGQARDNVVILDAAIQYLNRTS